jgi:uncharacterized protein (TIGR00661 family)
MKILYAMQGTGNGHLSRARDIIPILQKNNDLDLLISGTQAEVKLPYPVKYKFKGLGFIFGDNGGIDLVETYHKTHIKTLFAEINSLPVWDYDLVINDFEPVSAWACYLNNIKCISLSHQSAVLNSKAPQPHDLDIIGKAILHNYAPSTTKYGYHFKRYDENIFTPVIRQQVREKHIENKGHYTVYLPAYDDERILKVLSQCGKTQWQVFSKHSKKIIEKKNIKIQPICNDAFVESMATSEGVLCGAGFETPAEALFMKKKLMVIPMKGQYEQQCNAAALSEMGVPVLKSLKLKQVEKINSWIKLGTKIEVDYPDITADIINKILVTHTQDMNNIPQEADKKEYTFKKFRIMILKKIADHL